MHMRAGVIRGPILHIFATKQHIYICNINIYNIIRSPSFAKISCILTDVPGIKAFRSLKTFMLDMWG